jgi:hypothetical protein
MKYLETVGDVVGTFVMVANYVTGTFGTSEIEKVKNVCEVWQSIESILRASRPTASKANIQAPKRHIIG